MNRLSLPVLACVLAMSAATPAAHANDTGPERAFQDHIAYVATFAMPLLIERCADDEPGFMQRAAPLYFRFVNERQDAIERGRLLTLAEFAPDDTIKQYRERTVASRLGLLDTGTLEQKQRMCEGALSMLSGEVVPQGRWP